MTILTSIMALAILSLAIQKVSYRLHDYKPVFKHHIINAIIYIAEEIISAPFVLLGGTFEWVLRKLGFFRK